MKTNLILLALAFIGSCYVESISLQLDQLMLK
jgi:hypothetical protein